MNIRIVIALLGLICFVGCITSSEVTPTPTISSPAQTDQFDLAGLTWENISIDQVTGQKLGDLPYPAVRLDPSPDGRWVVLRLAVKPDQGQEAVLLVDTETQEQEWVHQNVFTGTSAPVWLSDGRLLALNDNWQTVLIQNQTHQILAATVPIFDLWYAQEEIFFGRSENAALWRLDLAAAQWQEVLNPQSGREDNWAGYWGLSQDGSYALAFQNGQMWHIPTEWNSPVEPLPELTPSLTVIGSGMPVPTPRQVGDTPYWIIFLPVVLEGSLNNLSDSLTAAAFMVNTQDGTLVTAETLNLPVDVAPTNYWLSPDGTWLIIATTHQTTHQPVTLYLTETDQFQPQSLQIDNGMVLGWHTESSTLIVKDIDPATVWLHPVPLNSGERIPLTQVDEWLTSLPDGIVMMEKEQPTSAVWFDLAGQIVQPFDFAPLSTEIVVAAAANEMLFLSVARCSENDSEPCTYSLVVMPID
jgi:hypothetical protein